jgi:uncharacterized protein YndB with AHSA1/START domain
MIERSVTHATFAIERVYGASPARLFAGGLTRPPKPVGSSAPTSGRTPIISSTSESGAGKASAAAHPGGPVHTYRATCHDIVPDERVVSTYDMPSTKFASRSHWPPSSSSLMAPARDWSIPRRAPSRTATIYAAAREHGTAELLDQLGVELEREG